jgi:hypothetical protein
LVVLGLVVERSWVSEPTTLVFTEVFCLGVRLYTTEKFPCMSDVDSLLLSPHGIAKRDVPTYTGSHQYPVSFVDVRRAAFPDAQNDSDTRLHALGHSLREDEKSRRRGLRGIFPANDDLTGEREYEVTQR